MVMLLSWFAYFKGWVLKDFKNISPQEAHALLENSHNITLVDVRSKKEFDKDHLEGAVSFPLENLSELNVTASKLLVYSERGELSVDAARILSNRGYKVLNLEGGVVFWIRGGYKVVED